MPNGRRERNVQTNDETVTVSASQSDRTLEDFRNEARKRLAEAERAVEDSERLSESDFSIRINARG